jgi:hypothetical protein
MGQGVHVRSEMVEPGDATAVPGAHSVMLTQIVAGFWSSSQVLLGHTTREAEPPAQNSPGWQGVHFDPEADDVFSVPAGQSESARQAT